MNLRFGFTFLMVCMFVLALFLLGGYLKNLGTVQDDKSIYVVILFLAMGLFSGTISLFLKRSED